MLFRSWREGDAASARLCFETAMSIDSANLDAPLTLGRLHLQQGDRAKGRAVFIETARRFPMQRAAQIALVYHDSLIGCGWWEELALLGIEQLGGIGRPEPLWLNAAVEGVRLRGWSASEAATRLERKSMDTVSRAMILAQAALFSGDLSAARRYLMETKVPLKLENAWIAARVWRRLGDNAEARLALLRTEEIGRAHV